MVMMVYERVCGACADANGHFPFFSCDGQLMIPAGQLFSLCSFPPLSLFRYPSLPSFLSLLLANASPPSDPFVAVSSITFCPSRVPAACFSPSSSTLVSHGFNDAQPTNSSNTQDCSHPIFCQWCSSDAAHSERTGQSR